MFSAITRTLNAQYQNRSYGLGSASTTYPVSAFITDLVYLEGTTIHVNVDRITVCSVSDLEDSQLIWRMCAIVAGIRRQVLSSSFRNWGSRSEVRSSLRQEGNRGHSCEVRVTVRSRLALL